MVFRRSEIVSNSSMRDLMSVDCGSGILSASRAMEDALAVMPNRHGPASSCSSLATWRRSSSCSVIIWR